VASERVLKKRAAHSHLSIRVFSMVVLGGVFLTVQAASSSDHRTS
jgi:hypothetical protein